MKKIGLGLLLFLLFAADAPAGGPIQIYPLKILLSPDKKTDSITLANQGDTAIDIQASAKSWDMDEQGKFIETDIGDFVFFPRLLNIPPHQEKSIRIGYNGNFPPTEKSYRLILEELPPVRTPEQQAKDKVNSGINWLMRLSVPMFAMPSADIPAPELKIDEVKQTTGGWSVAVMNVGQYHVYIKKLRVEMKGGTDVERALMRILPGRRVFIEVPVDGKSCKGASEVIFNFTLEQQAENYPLTLPLRKDACLPSL